MAVPAAGRVPAIHVLRCQKRTRGWPWQARPWRWRGVFDYSSTTWFA